MRISSFDCKSYRYITSCFVGVASDAKTGYATGHTINLVGQIAVMVLSTAGIAYCKWENRQRDLGKRDHRLNGTEAEVKDLGYRHPEFRLIH